jgi:hypothetical protein
MIKNGRHLNPKGVMNPYTIFCGRIRPDLQQQFPEKSMRELTCLMGKKWQELKTSEKSEDILLFKELNDLAILDRERYQNEKPKDVILKRERPNSAYKFFCSDPKNKNKTLLQINQEWSVIKKDPEQSKQYFKMLENHQKNR